MIVNKYGNGGSSSGVTPEQVQEQINSALTPYWDSAITESAITEAVAGKADKKTLVDFDHTTQAERAAVYAELKALYDGGSGATINKDYDFYKTVNTWQGLKIDYYGFSGETMVFGKVVSPENTQDQVVYEQVMTIDAAGNVNVVTNSVGGGPDLSAYYTSAQTDEKIASAVTPVAEHLAEVEQVTASAYTELHEDILELSARTVDMWDSAQTEDAISAATSGKADKPLRQDYPLAVSKAFINYNQYDFVMNGNYGEIMGTMYAPTTMGTKDQIISVPAGVQPKPTWVTPTTINGSAITAGGNIYAPESAGTAGDILVSTGNGAPVWSAMTFITSADVETQILSKNYITSADVETQILDKNYLDDEDGLVISTALNDLDDRVDELSGVTQAIEQAMVSSTDVRHIVKLTQAEYDQLATKDPETFYVIVNNQ